MKKVVLFLVMVLLVLVSARSLFCVTRRYDNSAYSSLYENETRKLSRAHYIAHEEYAYLKGQLDHIVSRDIDEASLKSLVDLLRLERVLVQGLLSNKTGQDVDTLLARRGSLLKKASKTAMVTYRSVMNFATSDVLFTGKRRGTKPGDALRGKEKKKYLKRVRDVLTKSHQEFSQKLYYVSQRTLGLPTRQYQPYIAQKRPSVVHKRPKNPAFYNPALYNDVRSNIGFGGRVLPAPVARPQRIERFRFFPHFCPWGMNRGGFGSRSLLDSQVDVLDSDNSTLNSRFSDMWGGLVQKLERSEVALLINEVLSLVNHEVKYHAGSKFQREKMFYGAGTYNHIDTSIDIESTIRQVSPKAKALFGTIREAASANTTGMGYWNPDLYEANLRKYAGRLEQLKNASSQMIAQFKNNMQEHFTSLQGSLSRLVDNFFHSVVPVH